MKEFEKWWETFCTQHADNCSGMASRLYAIQSIQPHKHRYQDGWRAALEWVLADLKAARDGFDLGLYDTLKKELNNE